MPKRTDISTILIIGAGPIVIGRRKSADPLGPSRNDKAPQNAG